MFQVKRESLNTVLDILAMVPEKSGLPSSEYIWCRAKGSRLTMSVASYISGEVILDGEGDWPFEENFYLDRRTFVPWVTVARESKDKHRFQFERRHNELIATHGKRSVMFTNQKKIRGYGDLKRIKGSITHSVPVSESLKEMLRCGSNCAVSDTIQPHLNAVVTMSKRGKVLSYAASDYVFYMGEGTLDRDEAIDKIPFPLFLINLLDVDGLRSINCVGKYVMLKFKHGAIWQPISEEANKNFPLSRIKKYAKQANSLPVTFTTSGRRFSRLMVRLGYYLQSVRRRDWVATVHGEKGSENIKLRTKIPGVDFKESTSISGKIKHDFTIEWPLASLSPVFDFLSKRTKKMPLVVRINHKQKISYVQAGKFWLCVPSRQEEI
jgi:hypothetical protein